MKCSELLQHAAFAFHQGLHCLLREIQSSATDTQVTVTPQYIQCTILNLVYFCLIGFFTSQSTTFQLCRNRSSWVEPVLSKDKCVLLKDTTQ